MCAKKCTIYYATTVGGNRWSAEGEKHIEPVCVEGSVALGKEPDWCCDALKVALGCHAWSDLYFAGSDVEPKFRFRLNMVDVHGQIVEYCPFCGAQIQLKAHLNLRVVETPRTVHDNHYEEV